METDALPEGSTAAPQANPDEPAPPATAPTGEGAPKPVDSLTSAPTGIKKWLATLKRELAEDGADSLIVGALLVLFCLVHRHLEVVEFGGDAVAKWHHARQWWYDFDWKHARLDHHTARFGVNAVAWLSQALFGRGWRTYYVAPFFIAILQLPFVYALAKRLAGRLAGVFAVLIVTYLATVHRSASQLLPDGFVGTYAIIATYFFARFAEAKDDARRPFLLAMTAMAFLAYLAKETVVFLYPGMIVAIYLARRSVRDVALFLGTLFGGLVLETLLYVVFTSYSSRYAAIRGTHGADGNWPEVTFWQLFDRFGKMHDGWKYLLFFALASGLWLLVLDRRGGVLGKAVTIIGLSHVFFLTFMMKGIHPIQLWQSFDPRYMEPFTPFAAVLSGTLLGAVSVGAWQSLPDKPWLAKFAKLAPGSNSGATTVWTLAFIALVGFTTVETERPPKNRDAFALGRRLSNVATNTYARNLPLVERRHRRPKSLAVLYNVYIDDTLLARDGRLPAFVDVNRFIQDSSYLIKDFAAYGPGALDALMAEGCYVEISKTKRSYELSHWKELPAKCDQMLKDSR